MPSIAVSEFVKRQTPESEFSHFTGTWEELLATVSQAFTDGHYTQGYRDGVVLVRVPVIIMRPAPGGAFPLTFYSNIVQLKEGDKLAGEFKARQPGEEPRKSVRVVGGNKMPAESVFVVLYRADVLAEGNERSSDADWEIISVNASLFPADVEVPMPVGTLMANHFRFSGGTQTGMTNDEFVAALEKSARFWKDKAMASGVMQKVALPELTGENLDAIAQLAHDQQEHWGKDSVTFLESDALLALVELARKGLADQGMSGIRCHRR